MATVPIDIHGKTIPDQLTQAQTLITQSTNNPNLPDVNPVTVVTMSVKRYALQVATANVAAAKANLNAKVAAQDAARAELVTAVVEHGAYVQDRTKGSAPGITSTGFDTQSESGAPIAAVAPENYDVTLGDEAGEFAVDWDSQRGVRQWETQTTADLTGASGWGNSHFSSKSQVDVKNCASGVEHLIRTRGLVAGGPGPWSQNVKRRAP